MLVKLGITCGSSVSHWHLLLWCSIFLSAIALAQTESPPTSGGLEEVVVTAQRKKENLQDVPISVAAFDQQMLDAEGLRSIDDISRLTPGVAFIRTGGSANNYNGENSEIALRGVQSTAGPQTTGLYIDDTPIQGRHLLYASNIAYPNLFDLDRVEVLRGPQGTLFGSGSEGGTIRFITPEPGLQNYTAYARAEYGDTDGGGPSYEVGGAVGGPIKEGELGFRLSASYREDGGWVDRVNYITGAQDENSNWQRTYTMRGALTYAPTETLAITPSVYYQELYVHDTGAFWEYLSDPVQGKFVNGNLIPNSSIDPFVLPSLKIDWQLGPAELISNTAYFYRHQSSTIDFTVFDRGSFAGVFPPTMIASGPGIQYGTDTQENFVQEIRLQNTKQDTGFGWVTGLFVSHQREDSNQLIQDPTLPTDVLNYAGYNLGPLLPGGFWYYQKPFYIVDKQLALFGQTTYRIAPHLNLISGLRVSRVEFDGYGQIKFNPTTSPTLSASASKTQTPVTPKIGLSWEVAPDNMVYATAAKGFRMGGMNLGLPPLCNGNLAALGHPNGVPPTYSSDSLWSYELGTKNMFWNRRFELNASLFWIDWKNIEQNIVLPTCDYTFVANIGEVASRGGDLAAQLRVTDSLTIGATLGYVSAVYSKSIPGATANVITEGDHLIVSPWTMAFSAEYVFNDFESKKPYARVDYQLSTQQNSLTQIRDPNNVVYDPTIPVLPSTKSLSARSGLRWAGLDISVYGNNLTNTRPILYTSHDSVTAPLYYQYTWRPRTCGVTATYRY
jgi:iron complex outermembrane recepter protein